MCFATVICSGMGLSRAPSPFEKPPCIQAVFGLGFFGICHFGATSHIKGEHGVLISSLVSAAQ